MRNELVSVEELAGSVRNSMCTLLDDHFEGVSPDQFELDLNDKQWALLIRDDDGLLAGFTTFAVVPIDDATRPLGVVYSGDTIMSPACWGNSALARGWITALRSIGREHGDLALVWLLICSGYRTYRFLPTFFREFYPRIDRPTPVGVRHLMDRLATIRYGNAYSCDDGIVSLRNPQSLRAHLCGVPASRRDDEHIRFFLRANPRHHEGDELVCFTALTNDNLTSAGQRMVRAGKRSELVAQ